MTYERIDPVLKKIDSDSVSNVNHVTMTDAIYHILDYQEQHNKLIPLNRLYTQLRDEYALETTKAIESRLRRYQVQLIDHDADLTSILGTVNYGTLSHREFIFMLAQHCVD